MLKKLSCPSEGLGTKIVRDTDHDHGVWIFKGLGWDSSTSEKLAT